MAPDTTPKQWPAWPRGLLDGAFRSGTVREPGHPGVVAAWRARMELRMDLERLGESLDGRMLRDIGAWESRESGCAAVDLPGGREAEQTQIRMQEDAMAGDKTPSEWPCEARGLLDDLADAVRRAGVFRRFGRFLDALRGSARAVSPPPGAEGGQMSATLEKGQCLALDGALPATVECLSGAAWITCPAEGKDVQLRAGQAARIESPANMVVAALGGPARIRLGWR